MAHALATRAHIRVDVLLTRFPVTVRAYLHALALLFLATFAILLAWRGWDVVQESQLFGAKDTSALSIPLVIPQALWAIGLTAFAALAVVMLVIVLALLGLGRRDAVDRMLGPRSLEEETEETLEAAGLVPGRRAPRDLPPEPSAGRHETRRGAS